MLEKVVNELLTIRGINIKYDWSIRERQDLESFLNGKNNKYKHLPSVRIWAEKLGVTPRFIIEILRYNKMEEIWK